MSEEELNGLYQQPKENKDSAENAAQASNKIPHGYKLNAMQCYNRTLKIINAKHAFKDRKKLSAQLKQLAKDVCQLKQE